MAQPHTALRNGNNSRTMPRKFFKRYMPDHARVREHRFLQLFGDLLHDPNLWHLNRRSASGAVAIGLFIAFMPIPLQMVSAAALAIALRVNLPVSVALVWLTNPITIPPMFYSAYKVGTWVLDVPAREFHVELSVQWLASEIGTIWKPLLTGCFLVGGLSALLGYLAVRGLWRLQLVRQFKRRKAARQQRRDTGRSQPS